jgi:hypothetical protein
VLERECRRRGQPPERRTPHPSELSLGLHDLHSVLDPAEALLLWELLVEDVEDDVQQRSLLLLLLLVLLLRFCGLRLPMITCPCHLLSAPLYPRHRPLNQNLLLPCLRLVEVAAPAAAA